MKRMTCSTLRIVPQGQAFNLRKWQMKNPMIHYGKVAISNSSKFEVRNFHPQGIRSFGQASASKVFKVLVFSSIPCSSS